MDKLTDILLNYNKPTSINASKILLIKTISSMPQ